MLPMETVGLTSNKLEGIPSIGGWTSSGILVSCSEQEDGNFIDMTSYNNSGSVVLDFTLVYKDVPFTVTLISLSKGSFSGLTDLTINGGPRIESGTSANYTNLETVTMNDITSAVTSCPSTVQP